MANSNGFYIGNKYDQQEIALIANEHRQASIILLSGTFISQFLFPAFVVIAFWSSMPHFQLLLWLAAHYVLTLIRIYFTYYWYKHTKLVSKNSKFDRITIILSVTQAILWAYLILQIDFLEYLYPSIFLLVVIFGHTSGALGVGAYWPRYYFFYTFVLLSSFFIFALIGSGKPSYFLAFAIFCYAAFLLQIVITFNERSAENIVLKFRNESLAKSFEKQRLHAEKLAASRRNLLAATSHDLRQPLQAMNLFLSVLNNRSKTPENKHIFNQLEESAKGMGELLNKVLDISKLDSETVTVLLEPVAMQSLLDKVNTNFRLRAENKGLKLNVPSSELWIKADSVLTERLLSNLLSNSIRYTKKGKIDIQVIEKTENSIELVISDTGIGINSEQQKYVFEEFYQVNNTERDRKKGLGLGLSIVKRLCDLMNIPLTMESEERVGTIFTLKFPKCSPVESYLSTMQKKPWSLANICIAVIDDDESVLMATKALLEQWGASIIAAESADSIIQQQENSASNSINLIISDYRLRNQVTGIDAIEAIRKYQSTPELPALLISGDTDPAILRYVANSGYTMIHKPIKPAQLRSIITRKLNEKPE